MSENCMHHIENHWKRLTGSANRSFNNSDLKKALADYTEALYRAEVLNNNSSDCVRLKIPFVQVYIISCNNLANTYEDLKNQKEADKILKQVIYFLLYMAKSEEVDFDEIQSELKTATLNYVSFSKRSKTKFTQDDVLLHLLKDQYLEKTDGDI